MDLMEMGFGDMDSVFLLKNKVQCRNFVAEPSASKTYSCALNQERSLFISQLTCLC